MQKKCSILLFMLIFSLDVIAQYSMENLSVKDGLSNNYVKDIVQDNQGCIWIATESGLSRFDGRKFTKYTVSNSGLQDDAINTLLYDKTDNLLWIGTKTVLSVLNCATNQFTSYTKQNDVLIQAVVDLEHASDGGIWITNHHNGIVHYNKKTKKFTAYNDKNIKGLRNSNWCSFDDGKGKLYVGHAQDGLTIIDVTNKKARHYRNEPGNPKSLPGNSVYSIFIDHGKNIWIGTNQGLALFNQRKEEFLVFKHEPNNPNSLIADHIYSIKEMNDGTLWVASDIGGISILDLYNISFASPKTIKFINIAATSNNNDLSSGNIRSLLQDSFGNIWIGNYGSGIDFIGHSQPVFHTLPYTLRKAKTLKNKPVWGIYADEQQQVWIGGENEIAVFKNNHLNHTIDITPYQNRPYTQVFSMTGEAQGSIFLGLYDDGLLRFDKKTGNIKRIDLGQDNIDIITFFRDTKGKMWIGTEYGIYIYSNGTVYKEEKISNQLADKSVYGILEDRQGNLWIASYGGGISIFDKEHRLIYKLTVGTGFFSNAINHLYLDSKGGVWIATRDGLGYIKETNTPKSFEQYGLTHRLEDVYVRAIQEDLSGNIWISTNQGISFWNKEKNRFNNYNLNDGIPAGNFIEGSACLTSDGTIYFGSLNGVCYFKPENVLIEHQVAPIQIIECKGFNKLVENGNVEYLITATDGTINLKYNQNSFRMAFAVPDYSQGQQVEYAYMVEGLDDIWYDTYHENQVTFRNIAPGNYTFKVKARIKNQDWDEKHVASMIIHIHPPLWLTWYAKLVYASVLCYGVFALIRSYKRKLKFKSSLEIERRNSLNEQNLNHERLGFYTNITHELRTPLTLILGPLEDLTNDKNLPSVYSGKIKIIYRSAVRLLNLINQILEFRKVETENRRLTVAKADISDLITEIGLRYKELNQNLKVVFHVNIETDRTLLYFDSDIITTILNNLLSNATKYTPKGNITLSLNSVNVSDKEFTEIRISDTGYGIDPNAVPYIFEPYYQAKGKHQASGTGIGLALVKSLVMLHEGIIDLQTELGKGTTFIFKLLTQNTYPNALHKELSQDLTEESEELIEYEENTVHTRPILLIAEDNNDIREYISCSLSPEYKIIESTTGKEGLELALTVIPDIIISDIMMPEMDGIEFCRAIKEDIRTSHIPVILLTAKDSILDKEEGYESGADSYLTKPFSARLLRIRITNLLESRKRLAQQIAVHTQGLQLKSILKPVNLSKLDREFLGKLTKIVEDNLDVVKLDISFITEKINMSHSTFYRKVKGLTGMTANEFIRKVKLKNSLKLLQSKDYNISEAAYMTGFNNLGHFRQCFKEEYGVSPSEYIRKKEFR